MKRSRRENIAIWESKREACRSGSELINKRKTFVVAAVVVVSGNYPLMDIIDVLMSFV